MGEFLPLYSSLFPCPFCTLRSKNLLETVKRATSSLKAKSGTAKTGTINDTVSVELEDTQLEVSQHQRSFEALGIRGNRVLPPFSRSWQYREWNLSILKRVAEVSYQSPDPKRPIGQPERYSKVFEKGKVYLLRLINTSLDTTLIFSIDGHNITVIGSDFVPITPYETNAVLVGIGTSSVHGSTVWILYRLTFFPRPKISCGSQSESRHIISRRQLLDTNDTC